MTIQLESTDREFLRRLHRHESATIADLCDAEGVTATAIRLRLSRLVAGGLVERHEVREGRGRPHHAYRLSERGQRELGNNYANLAAVLWQELQSVADPELRGQLLQQVQNALVRQYGKDVDGETVAQRLEQLRAALSEQGFDVEIGYGQEIGHDHASQDAAGGLRLPILRENSCPYFDLASSDVAICELEQRVFERVLGVPMTLKQRCVDGHACCEFEARG